MALDFPSSPTNGQVYQGWTWDATYGVWRSSAAYADTLSAGAIIPWTTSTPPTNWLFCDGSAVSRTTYASLFATIGTQYGSGDGLTTFNVPNLNGRTVVGVDPADSQFSNQGVIGGEKNHTLTVAEMPSHNHTDTGHSHAQYITANSGGPGIRWDYRQDGSCYTYDQGIGVGGGAANITYTGGGAAHNVLQPYMALRYIIKTTMGTTPSDSQLATTVAGLSTSMTAVQATRWSNNYVLNGAMEISQRGTSFSNPNVTYTLDRWCAGTHAAATVTQQSGGPTGSRNFLRYQRNSGSAVTTGMSVAQSFESINSIPLAGQQVTLSFYARAGANYSAASSALQVYLVSGTGTDQNIFSTYTGATNVIASTATLTASWVRYTFTATVPSNCTELAFYVNEAPVGTAGANDYYDITWVQLEPGATASAFHRSSPTFQAEFAACQRYFEIVNPTEGWFSYTGNGARIFMFYYKVTKRVAPTQYTVANVVVNLNNVDSMSTYNTSGSAPGALQASAEL